MCHALLIVCARLYFSAQTDNADKCTKEAPCCLDGIKRAAGAEVELAVTDTSLDFRHLDELMQWLKVRKLEIDFQDAQVYGTGGSTISGQLLFANVGFCNCTIGNMSIGEGSLHIANATFRNCTFSGGTMRDLEFGMRNATFDGSGFIAPFVLVGGYSELSEIAIRNCTGHSILELPGAHVALEDSFIEENEFDAVLVAGGKLTIKNSTLRRNIWNAIAGGTKGFTAIKCEMHSNSGSIVCGEGVSMVKLVRVHLDGLSKWSAHSLFGNASVVEVRETVICNSSFYNFGAGEALTIEDTRFADLYLLDSLLTGYTHVRLQSCSFDRILSSSSCIFIRGIAETTISSTNFTQIVSRGGGAVLFDILGSSFTMDSVYIAPSKTSIVMNSSSVLMVNSNITCSFRSKKSMMIMKASYVLSVFASNLDFSLSECSFDALEVHNAIVTAESSNMTQLVANSSELTLSNAAVTGILSAVYSKVGLEVSTVHDVVLTSNSTCELSGSIITGTSDIDSSSTLVTLESHTIIGAQRQLSGYFGYIVVIISIFFIAVVYTRPRFFRRCAMMLKSKKRNLLD